MKNRISIINLCLVFTLLWISSSCDKAGTTLYEQSPTIYFGENSRSYTFVENIDRLEIGFDTLKIPVQISGIAMDYDRKVKAEVVKSDTLNTAEEKMYEVLDGYVEKNLYKGYVPVRINYVSELDDSVYVIRLRLVSNEDFTGVDLSGFTISISITNKLTQPSNWNRLKSFFGPYSESWYRFILKETELSSIPYWSPKGSADPNNPDPEKWTMTRDEASAYAAKVKIALNNYNNDPKNPDRPLKHQDGPEKGKPVTMP